MLNFKKKSSNNCLKINEGNFTTENKLIKCPRCKRTIPAQDFRKHIFAHQGKKIITTKPTDLPLTLEKQRLSMSGFKEFYNTVEGSKPQKSNLTNEQIQIKFLAALKDVSANYKSVTFNPTDKPQFIEVVIKPNRDLIIEYNPITLRTIPENRIDALLLHEACHVSTLPSSFISLPLIGNRQSMAFQKDNVTNYDEYLAHVEFVSKFRDDPRFKALLEQQYSLTANFDLIIKGFRLLMAKKKEMRQPLTKEMEWYAREQVNSRIYDSLLFYVSGDPSLSQWFAENSITSFWEYGKWLYEDFEQIRKSGLSLKESHDKAMVSGTLAMSINPFLLLVSGKLFFASTTKQLHEELIAMGKEKELVQLWESRRKEYENQA
jgi:hypothetical protein